MSRHQQWRYWHSWISIYHVYNCFLFVFFKSSFLFLHSGVLRILYNFIFSLTFTFFLLRWHKKPMHGWEERSSRPGERLCSSIFSAESKLFLWWMLLMHFTVITLSLPPAKGMWGSSWVLHHENLMDSWSKTHRSTSTALIVQLGVSHPPLVHICLWLFVKITI